MAELTTRVTISVLARAAADAVKSLKQEFRGLGDSAKAADATGGQITRTRTALQSISTQLAQVRQAYLALQGAQAAGEALRGVFATADAYTNLTSRLRLASGSQAEFNQAFAGLRALADRTLAPLQETAQTYTRISGAVKNLGGGFKETIRLTEAVSLSLRISGASAEEQASALLQFAQGLQSNFQGDEFRALTENAPRLLRAVADGIGVSETALKGLSSAGKLTGDVVANALLKNLQQLRIEAQGLPVTVAGAFNVLQNAAFAYVGATDQARGSSSALANVLLTLAKNFETLAGAATLLVAAIAALGIGRLAAAFATLVTAGGGAAGVLGRIAALFGGPVGLVVSIAAAGAAWLAFGRDTDDATKRMESAKKEAEKLKEQIQALRDAQNEITRESPRRVSGPIRNSLRFLDNNLIKGAPSVEEATKGLRTRFSVLEEYKKRVDDVNRAFMAAIVRAQSATDPVERNKVTELRARRAEALAAAQKERDDSLAGQNPVRLPAQRQEFDAVAKLTKDLLDREKEELDLSLAQRLISIEGYYAERRRIADDETNNEVARLERERLAEEARIAELTKLRRQAAPDQKQQFDDQIYTALQKLKEINADVQIAQGRRATEGRKLDAAQAEATRELANQLATVRDRLLELDGGAGGDVVRQRLAREFQPLMQQLQAAGDRAGQADVLKLINVEAQLADLKLLEDQFNAALARQRNAEQSINVQRNAGLLSESQARAQLLEQQRLTAIEVEGLIPRMQALTDAIATPEAANRLGAIKVEFQRLKTVVDDVALSVNGALRDGLAGTLQSIATQGRITKDILLDLFRSVEQAITKIAAQKVADQIFPGGNGTGGLGAIISKWFGSGGGAGTGFTSGFSGVAELPFLHGGGIAGLDATFRRWVSPLAFVNAPRFHGGGLAGLAPGEVPAVLQAGEEVLTRNSPRHIRNGGGTTVQMTVVTPDANSFRRSQGQIEADMARALARGRRNL